MSLRDSFGKPKEGGKFEIITVGEGESKVFRFMAPMKSMAPKGIWGRYIKQHYGYGVKDKKNPDGKLRLRPFECIEEKEESGLVTTSCPEDRNIENQRQAEKDAIAVRTADLRAKGASKAELEAEEANVHKAFAVWFRDHNLDCKWFIPVKTEDGKFGLLKIPHKGKKAIDKVRTKMKSQKKPIEMLDIDTGFWVRVTRTGTGLQTDYEAEVVVEMKTLPNGEEYPVTKLAPLSDADLEQALASIPDLGSSQLVRRLTKDQIQMLVDSKGNPDVVETVLNMSQKVKTADTVVEEDEAEAEPIVTTGTVATTNPPPVQLTVTLPPSVQVTPAVMVELKETHATAMAELDEEAELMRKLQETRAKKAAAAAATTSAPVQQPVSKPATVVKAANPLDPSMSDDDFMRLYGPGSTAASAR
jgi:hypothetical protein